MRYTKLTSNKAKIPKNYAIFDYLSSFRGFCAQNKHFDDLKLKLKNLKIALYLLCNWY